MEAKNILSANILDILFEGRNKEYGAYDLRNTYDKRINIALGITALVIIIVCSTAFIGNNAADKKNIVPSDMKTEVIQKLHTSFEDVAHKQDGVEFWLARDLQVLLGYDEWRNFTKIIEKAQEACKNAGVAAEDQFVEVNKLITHGKGGQRSIVDFMLTRYACYLVLSTSTPTMGN